MQCTFNHSTQALQYERQLYSGPEPYLARINMHPELSFTTFPEGLSLLETLHASLAYIQSMSCCVHVLDFDEVTISLGERLFWMSIKTNHEMFKLIINKLPTLMMWLKFNLKTITVQTGFFDSALQNIFIRTIMVQHQLMRVCRLSVIEELSILVKHLQSSSVLCCSDIRHFAHSKSFVSGLKVIWFIRAEY